MPDILTALADKNVISKEDISSIRKEADSSGENIESILAKRGIDGETVLQSKTGADDIPVYSLGDKTIPSDILKYIPEESAIHYRIAPLSVNDGVLEVGITDSDNIDALDALNFISSKAHMPFKAYLISEDDFEKVLQMYKGLSAEIHKALSELDTEYYEEDLKAKKKDSKIKEKKTAGVEIIKEDAPVTKIVANILNYAIEGGVSDVHIENTEDKIRVRFRVDGVLRTTLLLPQKVHQAIVARIKVMSLMRLDEKRKPQDGRFSTNLKGRKIDLRVSTFPTYYGEKVVMRILDTEKGVKRLEDVGFSDIHIKLIRNAIKRPYGLILISGPTGSGKSTTLYSMLSEMDHEGKNILSLEDPVEYKIEGINQSQVKPEIGYTFANGLRTTLRQDPDIIMVGEIRDSETAKLAVQAALTGHLVLSTIHTNNAVGVIPRLIEMGVDPYFIAPTLILAMAQRLVKKLCPDSGKPVSVKGSIKTMLDKQFEDLPQEFRKEIHLGNELLSIEPVPECPSGTRGRTAVTEILSMNSEIEEIILKNPSESEIRKVARGKGMLTMKEDAIIKAFNKIIPFEEINAL
jgi:type IV pilus assembly protein PilB